MINTVKSYLSRRAIVSNPPTVAEKPTLFQGFAIVKGDETKLEFTFGPTQSRQLVDSYYAMCSNALTDRKVYISALFLY